MTQNVGFSLIELIVVLALISLISMLIPTGLNRLYTSDTHDVVVDQLVTALQACATNALREQRPMSVGRGPNDDCALPTWSLPAAAHLPEQRLIFYPDGTSSGGTVMVTTNDRTIRIKVDRLTSTAEVTSGAPAP